MVSHEVSHPINKKGISNQFTLSKMNTFKPSGSKISCDIFSFVHVFQYVSRGTCTQCVPVVLLANRDQFLDRSDRASNTSFVCWRSSLEIYTCKRKYSYFQFQRLLILLASREVLCIALLPQVILRQLRFAVYKEFAQLLCSDLLKPNNVSNVRGW